MNRAVEFMILIGTHLHECWEKYVGDSRERSSIEGKVGRDSSRNTCILRAQIYHP